MSRSRRPGLLERSRSPLMLMIALMGAILGSTPALAESSPHCEHDAELVRLADEKAIERLMAEYIWRLEAQDFEAYGQLFEHGSFLDPQGKVLARGASEVTAMVKRHLGGRPDLSVRRVTSSPMIDVDTDKGTATARSLMVTIHAPKGQPSYIFRVASYHDQFAKKSGRWQFASRQELTDWVLKEPPLSLPEQK